MKKLNLFGALAVAAVAIAAISCTEQKQEPQGLVIEKQGVFSSGGRVTEAIPGEYDATQNWLDPERKGTTTHVDHANTFYQIPAGGNGNPIVFLHGYGQTRRKVSPEGQISKNGTKGQKTGTTLFSNPILSYKMHRFFV